MKNDEFKTKAISTAAAILASDRDIKISGTEIDPTSGKSFILLSPFDLANEKYKLLLNGDLVINASDNVFFVNQLKCLIFENRYKRNE